MTLHRCFRKLELEYSFHRCTKSKKKNVTKNELNEMEIISGTELRNQSLREDKQLLEVVSVSLPRMQQAALDRNEEAKINLI